MMTAANAPAANRRSDDRTIIVVLRLTRFTSPIRRSLAQVSGSGRFVFQQLQHGDQFRDAPGLGGAAARRMGRVPVRDLRQRAERVDARARRSAAARTCARERGRRTRAGAHGRTVRAATATPFPGGRRRRARLDRPPYVPRYDGSSGCERAQSQRRPQPRRADVDDRARAPVVERAREQRHREQLVRAATRCRHLRARRGRRSTSRARRSRSAPSRRRFASAAVR